MVSQRKKSLSPSGAAAAFIIGLLTMAVPLRTFGVALIVFYLVGSRATKIGKALKSSLEEGHEEAGYRNASQVISNSFTALIAACTWSLFYTPYVFFPSIFWKLIGQTTGSLPTSLYNSDVWCAVDPNAYGGQSRKLVFLALGHFACCLGDTLASEIGILSKSNPFLITTFKRVPPGTNGALSALGTTASAAGGLIMGLTFAITLLIENSTCLVSGLNHEGFTGIILFVAKLALYGVFAGVVGSGIDSILGATFQETRYSTSSKRILTSDATSVNATPTPEIKIISGLNVLTNNQVNIVSSLITALILEKIA
ncbi:hypothetical protein FRB96_009517 [Tulasnella sp. 330]|nr:hypothetical protein FRB96_009517 [Tulasnella sp. 330]KAG8878664.1 hypothetical protein FRB98_006019 [Tulasnella sp. 332]